MRLALCLLLAAQTPDTRPQWIWIRREATEGEQARFEKRFQLAAQPSSARLEGSADNLAQVWINGQEALFSDDWTQPLFADVTEMLAAGENALEVSCTNESGPAAFQLALDLELAGGEQQRIVTDASWVGREWSEDERAAGEVEDLPLVPVTTLGPLGSAPWGELPAAKSSASRALPAEELEVPEGFRAELIYSVPRARQGSWVAMTFDERGRIIAADQYGPLWRVTLDGSRVTAVDEIALPFEGAQGLCVAFGALYAVSAGEADTPSGLYRMRDTDGDDRYDELACLKRFEGWGEHGPHAVVPGPDGKSLFVIAGNYTELPQPIARYRVPPVWGEDRLLPQHEDPNGHAVGRRAPGGWVCKTDRDGKDWELFACGLRNPYDLAFDADGEALTFDSDMEWDVGLPWYVPTRICHVTSGADFGWRSGSYRWPPYFADGRGAAADVGLSSPTGMCFGVIGDRSYLPQLFAGDWAYGTIYVATRGMRGEMGFWVEPFVRGKPLPVTDLAIGPDVAFWFIVGGRRTQSALYRIVSTRGPRIRGDTGDLPMYSGVYQRTLPATEAVTDTEELEVAFDALDCEEAVDRYGARVLMESRPADAWIPRALAETRPWPLIEAIIALARHAPPELQEQILARVAYLPLESASEQQLLAALRALELVFIRMGKPRPWWCDDIVARLDAMYPSSSESVNRELCDLLVFFESPNVVTKSLARLEQSTVQEDQIAIAWSLRTLRRGWTLDERKRYFRWLNTTAEGFHGGASFRGYMDLLREDAIASLSESERAALGTLIERPAAAAAPVAEVRFVRHWTLEDLESALARAGEARDLARGRSAYERARCAECHLRDGAGGSDGPDLTGAGRRFGERDLLEALVEPARVISDQYRDTEVITRDGVVLVGRIEARGERTLVLRTLDAPPRTLELDLEEIELVRPHALSRMPSGLLDALDEAEILDLIAYLRAGS